MCHASAAMQTRRCTASWRRWACSGCVPAPPPASSARSTLPCQQQLSRTPTSNHGTLRLEVETSSWVESVLPGLGYDRVRLVEIDLTQMPDEGVAPAQFDKARREFDAGRYAECVATCRAIRHAWERALDATTQQRPIAKALAEQLGRSDSDWPYTVLKKMWAGYADMTNAPHHPEQTPKPRPVTAADAKFCLLATLALSEYVDQLRSTRAGI